MKTKTTKHPKRCPLCRAGIDEIGKGSATYNCDSYWREGKVLIHGWPCVARQLAQAKRKIKRLEKDVEHHMIAAETANAERWKADAKYWNVGEKVLEAIKIIVQHENTIRVLHAQLHGGKFGHADLDKILTEGLR